MRDFFPEDVHDYRIDRQNFVIYVGGDPTSPLENEGGGEKLEPGVEHNMANRLEINLNTLSGIDREKPILIVMKTCGGLVDEGYQMFSALLSCPNPITVLAVKDASSMSSIIPLAADRFLLRPPAKFMFHFGTISFGGPVQQAKTVFTQMLEENERMLRIYTARLKEQGMFRERSEQEIKAMLTNGMRDRCDYYLSSDEAKKWGFVDQLFEGNFEKLRAPKRNEGRRKLMWEALRSPIKVTVRVS